jgi:hypothetical protein
MSRRTPPAPRLRPLAALSGPVAAVDHERAARAAIGSPLTGPHASDYDRKVGAMVKVAVVAVAVFVFVGWLGRVALNTRKAWYEGRHGR